MDKKHVSCMNMHNKRSVKLLIEKFECMGESQSQVAGKQQDWHLPANSGRVAATVAKFEHSSFLGHKLIEARLQHTCGDQATERWLAELKRKMNEVMKASQAKLALADNSIQSEPDDESELVDLRHQEPLLDPSLMPPVPPPSAADELSGDKSKHLLTQCSDTSVYNPNTELPQVPSFNGFDFCDEESLYLRPSLSCNW
ncbi:uncharacterized protein LOC108657299 isoform X2 [Drosophila navojoa]|uniref:uncharacterized protein LOC108657299 isoform X2 n=1 Tax=Drosophila navojoa TaxID=7232 RepID=UPI0008463A0E|nr:uncharacterized protein LOC108657299 isoform X2 [Drosophila navojoa]